MKRKKEEKKMKKREQRLLITHFFSDPPFPPLQNSQKIKETSHWEGKKRKGKESPFLSFRKKTKRDRIETGGPCPEILRILPKIQEEKKRDEKSHQIA